MFFTHVNDADFFELFGNSENLLYEEFSNLNFNFLNSYDTHDLNTSDHEINNLFSLSLPHS